MFGWEIKEDKKGEKIEENKGEENGGRHFFSLVKKGGYGNEGKELDGRIPLYFVQNKSFNNGKI